MEHLSGIFSLFTIFLKSSWRCIIRSKRITTVAAMKYSSEVPGWNNTLKSLVINGYTSFLFLEEIEIAISLLVLVCSIEEMPYSLGFQYRARS